MGKVITLQVAKNKLTFASPTKHWDLWCKHFNLALRQGKNPEEAEKIADRKMKL